MNFIPIALKFVLVETVLVGDPLYFVLNAWPEIQILIGLKKYPYIALFLKNNSVKRRIFSSSLLGSSKKWSAMLQKYYIAECRECLVYLILLQIRQIAKTLAIDEIKLSSQDYLEL